MWPFARPTKPKLPRTDAERRLAKICAAAQAYEAAFFASPVNANLLRETLLKFARVAYEEAVGFPFPPVTAERVTRRVNP